MTDPTNSPPAVVHGRRRNYAIPTPTLVTRLPDRPVACHICEWAGRADEGVAYRDRYGIAVACPTCYHDVLAELTGSLD